MTFDEALAFKKSIGYDKLYKENNFYKVVIIPHNQDDLDKYIVEYLSPLRPIIDEDSKYYSSHDEFLVVAIHYDGSNFQFKQIKVDS